MPIYQGNLPTPLNRKNIFENKYSTLYCFQCRTFCCKFHYPSSTKFDNLNEGNVIQTFESYRNMIRLSFKVMKSINFPRSLLLKDRIKQNIKQYNSDIKVNNLFHQLEPLSLKQIEKIGKRELIQEINTTRCRAYCYLDYLSTNHNIMEEIDYHIIENPLLPSIEAFSNKLATIFKYDPCFIAKIMHFFHYPTLIGIKTEIFCYIIYLRLQSNQYHLNKILNKSTIQEVFNKQKQPINQMLSPKRNQYSIFFI